MKSFFKTFFAVLLALVVLCVMGIFILAGFIASATSAEKTTIGNDAVLVVDLANHFRERKQENPIGSIIDDEAYDIPSLYDVVRMIRYAKADTAIKGIYLVCGHNANGFAASEELRKALADFKDSKKFIVAYGEAISQKGYYVGTIANKLYCHPEGGVEWGGFSSGMLYLKGALDKLEIQPQIFYAGKFKSATEPLRETHMTEANRLQTSVWLGDLYSRLLQTTAESRDLDTAKLRMLAVNGSVQTAHDALQLGLVDGLKYDDQVKNAILRKLHAAKDEQKINFVKLTDYARAVEFKKTGSDGRIAIVYAAGDIVDGKGESDQVSSDEFRNLIRKLRLDNDIKAIVFRVNSPGGSSLASDVIWREITLARKEKPVVVSMGDVAASGGYYISCNADSVFANANTITGSIGVFSIVPNFESFFRNKLGVTFDRVKTAPFADMGSGDRPLNETEKRFVQSAVDSIYHTIKTRVSEGRKKDMVYIDSIAQGRVWTGTRASQIGLVDRVGTMQDAVDCAARMAKLKDYRTREYPEKKGFLEQLMSNYKKSVSKDLIKEEIGAEEWKVLQQVKQVRQMIGIPQARMPFTVDVN